MKSARSIESRLEDDPENLRLIRLQLSHYEKLGWPEESGKSIERARKLIGLDPLFVNQQIDYFRTHELYRELLNLISEQELVGDIPKSMVKAKIEAAVNVGNVELARKDLDRLMELGDRDDYIFGAISYLSLKDTVAAMDSYLEAWESDRLEESGLHRFVPILLQSGSVAEVIDLLTQYLSSNNDPQLNIYLANAYYNAGDTTMAKNRLKPYDGNEELFLLSEWYRMEENWDSAQLCLVEILKDEPENRNAILQRGNIDQERGFLSRSLIYYNQLIALDSTDEEAIEQLDLVTRKIAYLQKIRETGQEIPILDLNSKKNNP